MQALQSVAAGHEPHPRTNWQYADGYAVDQWMGDAAHDLALCARLEQVSERANTQKLVTLLGATRPLGSRRSCAAERPAKTTASRPGACEPQDASTKCSLLGASWQARTFMGQLFGRAPPDNWLPGREGSRRSRCRSAHILHVRVVFPQGAGEGISFDMGHACNMSMRGLCICVNHVRRISMQPC